MNIQGKMCIIWSSIKQRVLIFTESCSIQQNTIGYCGSVNYTSVHCTHCLNGLHQQKPQHHQYYHHHQYYQNHPFMCSSFAASTSLDNHDIKEKNPSFLCKLQNINLSVIHSFTEGTCFSKKYFKCIKRVNLKKKDCLEKRL